MVDDNYDQRHEDAAARHAQAQLNLVSILASHFGPEHTDLGMLQTIATEMAELGEGRYDLRMLQRDIATVRAWRDLAGPAPSAT